MKITIIVNKASEQIKTVFDHVHSFKKYSKHDINYIDQNDFKNIYKIKSDVVVLHYSIMHSIVWCLTKFITVIKFKENVTKKDFEDSINNKQHWANQEITLSHFFHLTNFLLSYSGNKFAFIQDEYYDTNLTKIFLEIINVNTVFTCIPDEHISKIYDNLNNTGFINNLTGYVPDYNFERIPIKNRNCDVFYRGRELHYWYGDLGQDKMNIGKYMKKYCDEYNLISNIDWDGNNCIYGDEWFKVLGNSKVTLGTESGTTIFDMDNSLLTEINILLEEQPAQSSYTKKPKYSYDEICNKVNLKKNEVPNMGQVSPKMFEAIMLGTALVMYEGNYYPGILIPDVHYIVLKKDHSNIKDVINKIKDDDFLQKMADRAYNDIIRSGKYSYKKFIEMFDKEVENKYIFKPNYARNKNLEWYQQTKYMNKNIIVKNIYQINNLICDKVLMLRAESFGLDPRRDTWYESSLYRNIKLCQQCIIGNETRLVDNTIPNNIINIKDTNNYSFEQIKNFSDNSRYLKIIEIVLKFMTIKLNITCNYFEWYKTFILSTIYKHIKNYKNEYKVIIAINFPTLIAAILLKSIYNVKVIYECLEWFPYHNNIFTEEENTYWMNFEKEIVKYADYWNIVSPGLANLMSTTYSQKFNYIPNCVPLSISKSIIKTDTSDDNKCRFLFQGCISEERNIDFIINIWDKVNKNAILIIRGPYWKYVDKLKQLAKNKNLLDNTIFFPEEIPSNKLLEGIVNDCNVGIIPYGPLNMNYKHCSPNKMGEYISMGKPILANNTEYVSQVISEADCGIVVDFKNENLLIEAINKLTIDKQLRRKYSENSFNYHKNEFNWEKKSLDFYNKIFEFLNF
jgi:glycosyltransferase involved in cell wall biosynthesis